MNPDLLRIAALLGYLASWLVIAVIAIAGARPELHPSATTQSPPTPITILATLLQASAALAITLYLPSGPLRPHPAESAASLVLAPLGAALFFWARRSAPNNAEPGTLITSGAYAHLRHPIYAAFLALLTATGLLASARYNFAIALIAYLAGTEIRIAREELELTLQHPVGYAVYQRKTPWRYLPGVR